MQVQSTKTFHNASAARVSPCSSRTVGPGRPGLEVAVTAGIPPRDRIGGLGQTRDDWVGVRGAVHMIEDPSTRSLTKKVYAWSVSIFYVATRVIHL